MLKIYQPESGAKDFNDPDWGKQQGQTFISQGADVIFGAGGQTGNGALLAAKDAGKFCVGVDVDQYISYPDVASCLITSAEKHLDLAVKQAVTDMTKGTARAASSASTSRTTASASRPTTTTRPRSRPTSRPRSPTSRPS